MAASDPVSSVRQVINQGDVEVNRPVSQSSLQKFAAQSNFINNFQVDSFTYNLNGSFNTAINIPFYDGLNPFFYNSEIVAVSFWQLSGVSGTTQFDLRYYNTSGADQGSIFSVKPTVTATGQVYAFRNLVTNTDVQPSGTSLPTFSKTNFLEGEALYLNLDSAMSSATNGGIRIFYRPIN